MTDPWPLRSSLELGALSTAVPCACLHVKHVLWEWGLNGLAGSAELLVSELVSNAVDAAGQPGQTVSVNLAGNATRVLIEVRDADPRPPAPSWNRYPTQEPPGKAVWCELSAEPPAELMRMDLPPGFRASLGSQWATGPRSSGAARLRPG